MWDPPRPGLEPVSPALAGRLSTTAPPGKPWLPVFVMRVLLVLPAHSCAHLCTYCPELLSRQNGSTELAAAETMWPANLKLCPLTHYRKSLMTHVFGNGANCKPLSPSLTAHQQTKAGRARKKVPWLCPISSEHKTSVEQHLFTCPWNILEMLV